MKRDFPFTFFLVLLSFISIAFFWLIKPYLLAVFWAITLALMFRPLHQKILHRVGERRNLAGSLTLMTIILLVIIPTFFVGQAVVDQSVRTFEKIESGEIDIQARIDQVKAQLPLVDRFLNRLGVDSGQAKSSFNDAMTETAKQVSSKLLSVTQDVVGFVIEFALMLYILFFFLRDGRTLLVKIIEVLPIGDDKELQLLQRFESVTRATVRGSLVIAIVQGSIGGLLFWSVGISSSALWGVLMTLLSLLPLGSGIIWIPAGIMFLSQGAYGKGIFVLLVGGLVIGLIDNLLRPRLVGNDTKMPDYLVLLSTLGGLAWFGVSGFIIGPLIAALFITCWSMIGESYGEGTESAERVVPQE